MNDRRSRGEIKLGERGERFAQKMLRKDGYRILDLNVRKTGGEIDIVAVDHGTICFVEVKTRSSDAVGTPEEAVDRRKIMRIVKAAKAYSAEKKLDTFPVRYDIVTVRVGEGRDVEGRIIKGAFGEDGWG